MVCEMEVAVEYVSLSPSVHLGVSVCMSVSYLSTYTPPPVCALQWVRVVWEMDRWSLEDSHRPPP
jgi:hypothetical protein